MRICWMWVALSLALVMAYPLVAQGANWTFMVYLDGDNDLSAAAIVDLGEMDTVGSTAEVNIVVLLDREANGDSHVYKVIQGSETTNDEETALSAINPAWTNEVDMSAPGTLVDFVEWGMTNYPATNYAVVLWNHGSGWRNAMKAMGKDKEAIRAVCWDDTTGLGECLYMDEVQAALDNIWLATGKRINLIGFDACLMAMVEVAYEIREHVDVMVGSEEVEPWDGWPYNTILGDLVNTPTISAADLASIIVTRYGESYPSLPLHPDQFVTQSAQDLTQLNGLASKVDTFAQALDSNWAQIAEARDRSEEYDDPKHVDLGNLTDSIKFYVADSDIQNKASDLKTALNNTVTAEFHKELSHNSSGLAIYFPEVSDDYDSNYDTVIDFSADTYWETFLKNFYKADTVYPTTSTITQPGETEELFTDDAESGIGNWEVSGFATSASQAHGGYYSFYSDWGDNLNNSMTLKSPVSLPDGEVLYLDFWCYYDIEEDFDYAYVEVSTDGSSWVVLDRFTGTQTLWTKKSYPLDGLAGSSIYLRFVYTTDERVSDEGFYVDDIAITTYGASEVLSDTLVESEYFLRGKSNGIYYYRTRARDNGGNWGKWSNIRDVTVDIPLPSAPGDLSASAVSSSQINLNWTDNSDNEVGFSIERKTGTGETYGEIATVDANVATYSDKGLSAGTTHYYRVRAYNGGGYSDYSNEADASTLSALRGGSGGGGCFVATAAYGTPMAEEIKALCDFRDKYLLTNPAGQALVRFYYRHSPRVAGFIQGKDSLKAIVRAGLRPLILMIKVALNIAK